MCILADKYDIAPLHTLAVEKFKKATVGFFSSEDENQGEFCKALRLAWQHPMARSTEQIRERILDLMLDSNIMAKVCDKSGQTEYEEVFRRNAGLTTDFAMAQQGRWGTRTVSENEERYKCLNCSVVFSISTGDLGRASCDACTHRLLVVEWAHFTVE